MGNISWKPVYATHAHVITVVLRSLPIEGKFLDNHCASLYKATPGLHPHDRVQSVSHQTRQCWCSVIQVWFGKQSGQFLTRQWPLTIQGSIGSRDDCPSEQPQKTFSMTINGDGQQLSSIISLMGKTEYLCFLKSINNFEEKSVSE